MPNLSPAAHYALACVADRTLTRLRCAAACDLIGRWYRLAHTGHLPSWESLQGELWTAGYLPNLYCLWRQPTQLRTLCPLAARLLELPWLSDRLSGLSALPFGHPARDWLREQG